MVRVGGQKVGRNDPCHCGSGVKYKRCCLKLQDAQRRLPQDYRTIILAEQISEIFALEKARAWEDVRNSVTPDRVRELYQTVNILWPEGTDVSRLLPEPSDTLSGLYLGEITPESLLRNICRVSLYTDRVYMVSPFHVPWNMESVAQNPIDDPALFLEDTLRILYFLHAAQPWLETGFLRIIPDPNKFSPDFRRLTLSLAARRVARDGFQVYPDAEFESEMFAQELRMLSVLPREARVAWARRTNPEATEDEIENLLAWMDSIRETDPLMPPPGAYETPHQLYASRMGVNVETAWFLADASGSFPFTSRKQVWAELKELGEMPEQARIWTPLSQAFQQLEFQFLNAVKPDFVNRIRDEGRLARFRTFLRKIWEESSAEGVSEEHRVREYCGELEDQYARAKAEWMDIDKSLCEWAANDLLPKVMLGGALMGGAVLSGGLSVDVGLTSAAGLSAFAAFGAGVAKVAGSGKSREMFRLRAPISVLIDLESDSKRWFQR